MNRTSNMVLVIMCISLYTVGLYTVYTCIDEVVAAVRVLPDKSCALDRLPTLPSLSQRESIAPEFPIGIYDINNTIMQ